LDCGKTKMLFETEKKADTFIKFNSEEIATESGYCPQRSYYCALCCGWHTTSKDETPFLKEKTENTIKKIDIIIQEKQKKKLKNIESQTIFSRLLKQIDTIVAITEKEEKQKKIDILQYDVTTEYLTDRQRKTILKKIDKIKTKD